MQPVCTRCLTPLPQHPVLACLVCGTPVISSQGAMFLVVENIDEGATDLSYSVDAKLP